MNINWQEEIDNSKITCDIKSLKYIDMAEQILREKNDYISELRFIITELNEKNYQFKCSEKKLSDAYLRIRSLVGAFDTPTAPTQEQIFELTEKKIKGLISN